MAAAMDPGGRVALVVGAQRGIGFACAAALAEAGMVVACADLPGGSVFEAPAKLTGRGHSAHAIDLTALDTIDVVVREVVDRHGRLDVLVSAAGHLAPQPFLETTAEVWQRTLAVNTTGAVFVAQAAARQFLVQGSGGRIILFASIVGWHVVRL